MLYPTRLLPRVDYRIIGWREELLLCYLVRSTSSSDLIDSLTGMVRAKHINDGSREHLKDFSTNLLGIFAPAYSAIKINPTERKAYFIGYWVKGEHVDPPGEQDFSIMEDYGNVFYKIADLQGFPQPFSIATKPGYVGECFVAHTPTRSNFWHFSVRWKINGNDIEEVLNENERRNLLGLVRSFLIEKAIIDAPNFSAKTIKESRYKP
jgi:hypothetical protein